MIDLYTWGTPNGRKVSIMLEETGLPYKVHKIDISKNDQFKPDFLAINPNSKIPAIVDPDGPGGKPLPLFESGAILIYLADKTGKFHSSDARTRYIELQWLMFQMGGVGPMFGQAHHFMRAAKEQIPYGIERYGNEAKRLYGVMNARLGESAYLASKDYSIADIATYPWVARHEWHRVDLAAFPNVQRWYQAIGARAPVQRGMAVPS
jgi:GST-like protein